MKNCNYGGSIKPPNLPQKIKIRIELWFENWLYRLGIKKTKILTNEEILGTPVVTQRIKLPSVTAEEANQTIVEVLTYMKRK